MSNILADLISDYKATTLVEYDTAFKEISQKIILLGLWRAKFFEHAAFYGGTALRILYNLDRFSEDLDFSLLSQNHSFELKKYLTAVQTEMRAYGIESSVSMKQSPRPGNTESAFVKADTKELLLEAGVPASLRRMVPVGKLLKIKFEVDVDPPSDFRVENKTVLSPIPFSVNTYTLPDIFAGKMHALLCRVWKERVKGRDWYDFIWFVRKRVPLNLKHLQMRLIQTGHLNPNEVLTNDIFLSMFDSKIADLNIDKARDDVSPFIIDESALAIWSKEFFRELIPMIKYQDQ